MVCAPRWHWEALTLPPVGSGVPPLYAGQSHAPSGPFKGRARGFFLRSPGPILGLSSKSLRGHRHSPVNLARPVPRIKGLPENSRLRQALLVWIYVTRSENVPGPFQTLLLWSLIPDMWTALLLQSRHCARCCKACRHNHSHRSERPVRPLGEPPGAT